jgi:glutamate/tyrosine decarboxylase-like PLP-dependent enzyme
MSAICIRHRGADPDGERSKQLHAHVVRRIEQSGKFWISTTELKGKTWFRINPVNFRTRIEHMDQLLKLIEKECRSCLQTASFATDEAPAAGAGPG